MTIDPIITNYFHAWLEQDCDKFLRTLSADFYARECTGDVYQGINIARDWFEGWHKEANQVLSWTIENAWNLDNRWFLTWTFTCKYDQVISTFKGMTHLRIQDNKIIELNEYSQEFENRYPYGRPMNACNETS